jgi:hypothetical protein
MGMFDSFYTNEGKEIQTKKLDSTLSRYCIGDTVPDYELNYDGATGNYYLIEEYQDTSLIIINNIFIDYLVDADHNALKANTNHLFKTYLSNHELLSLKLSNIIKEKLNLQRNVLSKKMRAVEHILHGYTMYQENPDCTENKFLTLAYSNVTRFKQGESLEKLLNEALKMEDSTQSSFLD